MIPGSSLFDRYHNLILEHIHGEMDIVENLTLGGSAQDFQTYRHLIGQLHALRKVESEIAEIYKTVTET